MSGSAPTAMKAPLPATYRFNGGRLTRNLVGLLPFAGFPVALHLTGLADPLIYALFGAGAGALVVAVIYSAARYKLVVSSDGLDARGRLHHRRIRWEEITAACLRRGREKAPRFMGPPPFRELVLQTASRNLVISSLPLGEEHFTQVTRAIAERLPAEIPFE